MTTQIEQLDGTCAGDEGDKGDGPNRWRLVARQVPLTVERGKETQNRVRLTVATAEGEADAALPEPGAYKAPPGPPMALPMTTTSRACSSSHAPWSSASSCTSGSCRAPASR